MEAWLTRTVPGIIILGAAGSLLALGILWAFRLIPLPLKWHRKRQTRQAFMLGYSAATVEHDETGRRLVALMAYHTCLLLIYLTTFSFCGILFLIVLASQSQTALTWGTFLSSAAAFTIAYLAYFEFDFVRRTYLFFWKSPLTHARASYEKRSVNDGTGKATRGDASEGTIGDSPPTPPTEEVEKSS
jgi:hypothetical protein